MKSRRPGQFSWCWRQLLAWRAARYFIRGVPRPPLSLAPAGACIAMAGFPPLYRHGDFLLAEAAR